MHSLFRLIFLRLTKRKIKNEKEVLLSNLMDYKHLFAYLFIVIYIMTLSVSQITHRRMIG
jgi:hypothetical protein